MFKKNIIGCAVAASAMMAFAAPAAHAEIGASVGAANMYYWRGVDLGAGDAQIWGDINYSEGGFYAGMWAASGDAGLGQEYDLYVGYGGEVEGFSYDLSAWTYVYPSSGTSLEDPGELTEVILSLGAGPFSFAYYDNVAGGSGYTYMTLGVGFGDFSLTYGMHDADGADSDSHLDLAYAYNDNLTFIVGTGFDDPNGAGGIDDTTKMVVSFSIPIEM